ncbi:Rieske (2Fe-2S) protein [Paenibacillus solisilvae]|uniref:Rieske (2Fe-2S) protein n=1 Tax=Paenibacillus solisilvae TaxID=2486751 RepID=A0ABW0VQC0_9BACL
MNEYKLGKEKDFDHFPVPVEIESQPYYLLKNEFAYLLASRICPHMGYPVETEEGGLVCFLHGWTFDERTGICKEISHERLTTHPVFVRNGELIVWLKTDEKS